MSETTFHHSKARVPRLYKCAGKVVKEVRVNGGSVKGLLYQTKHKNTQGLYALVTETLRHESELAALIRETGILVKEPRLDPWVTRVLMIELLWKNRPLAGPAIPLKIVRSYKSEFLSKQAGIASEVTKPVSITRGPRFVRINTLKISKEEIIDFFTQEGWQEIKENYDTKKDQKYPQFLRTISSLSDDEFLQDAHVPNLLVFPRSMMFHNLDYYCDGSIIIQDKASCMSAFLLNAPPGSTVLDMCAAPGMKTTHVAATINNVGTIYAIEKHAGRFDSLSKIVSQAGASCVKPLLGDALRFSDQEIPDVEYILVDPSCSGSGMKLRSEIFNEPPENSRIRLESLASFQCRLLQHAMTSFPKAKRIVYSTCSVHPEENEAVVEYVLKNTPPNFIPINPGKGVEWMTRGSPQYNYGNLGFYTKPEVDMTNGFFLTVFERTENEYVQGETSQEIYNKEASERGKKGKKERSHTDDASLIKLENCEKEEYNIESVDDFKFSLDTNHKNIKKEKRLKLDENLSLSQDPIENSCEEHVRKKKRKSKSSENLESTQNTQENCPIDVSTKEERKQKSKKSHCKDGNLNNLQTESVDNLEIPLDPNHEEKKKKKKSKKDASLAASEDPIETSCEEPLTREKKERKSKSSTQFGPAEDACDDCPIDVPVKEKKIKSEFEGSDLTNAEFNNDVSADNADITIDKISKEEKKKKKRSKLDSSFAPPEDANKCSFEEPIKKRSKKSRTKQNLDVTED